MELLKFEELACEIVQRIFRVLQSQTFFANSPQLWRAIEMEDELFRLAKAKSGFPDDQQSSVVAIQCVKVYRRLAEKFISNLQTNHQFWPKLQRGKVSTQQLLKKLTKNKRTLEQADLSKEAKEELKKRKKQKKEEKKKKKEKKDNMCKDIVQPIDQNQSIPISC